MSTRGSRRADATKYPWVLGFSRHELDIPPGNRGGLRAKERVLTTKPPSGSGLAEMTDDSHDSIDDAIGDILLETAEKPLSNPLTLPAPMSSVQTPAPVSAGTPGPIMTKTPAPLMTKTPAPLKLGTPGPVLTKTPAPLTSRDPSSALPSIPAPTKEPSGAFPLPGMAPEAGKSSDDDVTLIARLSVLDDLAEEPTQVEAIDDVLRATSAKEEPIALADQATAERDRALGVSAVDRMSAAEFEDPGDDEDEMTVSATPGIISISEEDEDDDEPTASQRPPSARKTPTPATGGPHLSTPAPLSFSPSPGGGPRLPAPTPPPGRTMHLPTPSGGMPSIPMPLASPASAPQRSLTPALPIPAPQGFPPTVSAARSAIFNKVQLPLGGLVAFFAAAFGAGVVFGGWMWGRQPVAPTPVAAEAPASATTVAKTPPTPEAEPTPVA